MSSTITTVKLQKSTKRILDHFRAHAESYDTTIKNLIAQLKKKHLKATLIEAYKDMGKRDKEFLEEWDVASASVEV